MFDPAQKARNILTSIREKKLSRTERIPLCIELASLFLDISNELTDPEERKRQAKLAALMESPSGKTFLTSLADQCFRSASPKRTAEQIVYLLKTFGLPSFLDDGEKIKFLALKLFGARYPRFFVPALQKYVRKEFSSVLLCEAPRLKESLLNNQQHVLINFNRLGEAILSEQGALKRLESYQNDLLDSRLLFLSVKISSLYSQIDLVGWEESLQKISERLRLLYRVALQRDPPYPMITLDMEETKDVDLTVAVFKQVLSEPEFFPLSAGIVLQSYLPQSFPIQQALTAWAKERVAKGGAPIKIRLVKGANLSMEKVEASLKGWQQAPYLDKLETDANFIRMLEWGLSNDHAPYAHIGIGTHNLFDIAYAQLLIHENQTQPFSILEMLYGMAEGVQKAVLTLTHKLLLYTPETTKEEFHSAIAYLIRRLDENTGPHHFLRHLFDLSRDSPVWEEEIHYFKKRFEKLESLSDEPRRKQNHLIGQEEHLSLVFQNEPDTDFSLVANRTWSERIYKEWKSKEIPPIPLVVGGKEIHRETLHGTDPSRPGFHFYEYSILDKALVNEALQAGRQSAAAWKEVSIQERSQLFEKIAFLFRKNRGALIGAMIADCGKVFSEADTEVSEAIDFLEYYRRNWEKITAHKDQNWVPKGLVLVCPPWNFPCSIPVSGIAAALMAGNSVLFKPAPESILVGWTLVKLFWEAGIPSQVLQWIPCRDHPEGTALIQDSRIDAVILTGATSTATHFMRLRPSLHLLAETGGKNAMILSDLCDRDLAIKDLLTSAFGHAGQKCSACSLAILHRELYEDSHFLSQLAQAAESLQVGVAWNPSTKVPPLIHKAAGPLLQALTTLDEGESWLLKPRQDPYHLNLWSPGIKLGVKRGSFSHCTEFFGPLLSIMKANDLEEAIAIANDTPYGLTAGLHSLDDREHLLWENKIIAGNLYINRTITGAIVRRQPFGGCKESSFGPGAKAGGPNYVAQCATLTEKNLPEERSSLPSTLIPFLQLSSHFGLTPDEMTELHKSAESYAHWAGIFKEPIDLSCLLGQDNFFYYVPKESLCLRVDNLSRPLDFLKAMIAASLCLTSLTISMHKIPHKLSFQPFSLVEESEESFLQQLSKRHFRHVRLLSPASSAIQSAAAEGQVVILDTPVYSHGRFELLHYVREISLSHTYHRYGYLGLRDLPLT